MAVAVDADLEAWRYVTVIEAKRIMERLGVKAGGGIRSVVASSNTVNLPRPYPIAVLYGQNFYYKRLQKQKLEY